MGVVEFLEGAEGGDCELVGGDAFEGVGEGADADGVDFGAGVCVVFEEGWGVG